MNRSFEQLLNSWLCVIVILFQSFRNFNYFFRDGVDDRDISGNNRVINMYNLKKKKFWLKNWTYKTSKSRINFDFSKIWHYNFNYFWD